MLTSWQGQACSRVLFCFFQSWTFITVNLLPWDRSPTPAPWRSLVFQPEDCQDSGPLAATQPGKWCELLLSCLLGWTEHSTSDESEATAVAGSQESCCLPGLHAQLGCVVSVELADMTENKENKLTLPLRKKKSAFTVW